MWNTPCTSRRETDAELLRCCGAAPRDHIADVDDVSNLELNTPVMMSCTIFERQNHRQNQHPSRSQQWPDIQRRFSLATNISVRMISAMVAALRSNVPKQGGFPRGRTAPYSGFSLVIDKGRQREPICQRPPSGSTDRRSTLGHCSRPGPLKPACALSDQGQSRPV